MAMPETLVLIRHGESEGNVVTTAAKHGDTSLYTDAFITTPGHQWRLTATGRDQARAAGQWIAEHIGPRFDRYYVSPYVRTRETAAHLALPAAAWLLNRSLREREWGDIGSLPRNEFLTRPEYQANARLYSTDPLYWTAPNGESIATVAENRVRNVLDTLHRECSEQRVIAVAHGELMQAFRLVLERQSDEEFAASDADPAQKIRNCAILQYTRRDPVTHQPAPRLTWVRTATPVHLDGTWTVQATPWREITTRALTNDELLAQVADVPYLLPAA